MIVDEVQDLNCVGLQFLHALVGDRPDGLLMVGDGQQAVYPGGFTLAEAGISVVGRSTVLTRNYRNGERILRHALGVVAGDEFDDLDADRVGGLRDLETARPGGTVVEFGVGLARRGAAMCSHIRKLHEEKGVRYGDMAVLAPDNTVAGRWREVLRGAGIPVISLEKYAGHPRDQVKVGTFTEPRAWSSRTSSSRTGTGTRGPGLLASLATLIWSGSSWSGACCSWP